MCKEAQPFTDLGRADHIIPFIIEGNPFSGDTATEYYPNALRNLTGSNKLLAANINEMGRDAAAMKVVARKFNLRFDTLWQRHKKEKRRQRWLITIGALTVMVVGLVIGFSFAHKNQLLRANAQTMAQQDERHQTEALLL